MMDLNSWTPQDKTRRLATLIAAYLAVTAAFVFWLGLHWTWYLAALTGIVLYFVVYALSYAVLKGVFRG